MSHGNVTTAVGDCEVCGRVGVDLHQSRNVNEGLGRPLYVCSDEFACHTAWVGRLLLR